MIEEFKVKLISDYRSTKSIKEIHKDLCDSILCSDILNGSHIYSNIHKLIYKVSLGKNTYEFRKINHINRGKTIIESLNHDQLKRVKAVMSEAIKIIDSGLDYYEIKNHLLSNRNSILLHK